jgi:hypothetical protein
VVRPASRRIPRVRRYSRNNSTLPHPPSPTGLSPAPAARSSSVPLTDRYRARGRPPPPNRPFFPHHGTAGRLNSPSWFGLLPVRSPLLGESSLFLEVLRCFSSPRARAALSQRRARPVVGRVAPFGIPWIAGRQHLPRAFRRVAASFIGRDRQGIHRAPIFANLTSARSHPFASARLAPLRDQAAGRASSPSPSRVGVPNGRAPDGDREVRPPRTLHLSMCSPPQWSRGDSNPGPPPCKGGALPAKLRPRVLRTPPVPRIAPAVGGRAWTRTRDLGLIRAAL